MAAQPVHYHWANIIAKQRLSEMLAALTTLIVSQLPSRRLINGLGGAACLLMLAFAYYLQYQKGLQPCPLCIIQRLLIATLGLGFLAAAIHNPAFHGARRYALLLACIATLGMAVAGYQIWLQSLSSPAAAFCLPPLDYLLTYFPFTKAISMILQSPGECGEIQWTMLGLSIPGWTCMAFFSLGVMGAGGNWLRS